MHIPPTTIIIGQRLDCVNAPVFKRLLAARIRNGQHTLLIDLTRTHYLGIPGLRMLLAMQKQARRKGGELILVGLQPALQKIFSQAELLKTFTQYPPTSDSADSTPLYH